MTVHSYDSFEEMLAAMARAEDAANARVTDEQRAVTPGDFVIQLPRQEHPDLLIVGKTYSMDEFVAGEKEAYDRDPDEDDPWDEEATIARYQGLLDRNYLFGRWYSLACPEGEYGDVHRSVIGGIIPQWFADQLLNLIQ